MPPFETTEEFIEGLKNNGNMKLIDKDALVAEIERRIKTNKECMLGLRNLDYYQGKVDALNDTISSIATLEVTEVDLNEPFNGVSVKTSFDSNDNLDEVTVTTKYKKK